MSLSRRALFKGAAATGATLATGGAGKMAQGAVMAAGGAAGLGAADKVSRVLQSLGGGNGAYPVYILTSIAKKYKRDPNAEGGYKSINVMQSLQDRLLGKTGWSLHEGFEDIDPNRRGKIDFNDEINLHDKLSELPDDLPILDALSEEILAKANPDMEQHKATEYLRKLRQFFEPLCDENTTPADLKANMEGYFLRLARHAVKNPNDFGMPSSDYNGPLEEGSLYGRSDIRELSRFIRGQYAKGNPEMAGLADELEQLAVDFEARVIPDMVRDSQEKWQRRSEEAVRQGQKLREEQMSKRDAEIKEKETNPDARRAHRVQLFPAFAGQYILRLNRGAESLPTRMDWVHWVQSMDPENMRPSEITLDDTRAVLTLKNQLAIDFLKTKFETAPHQVIELDLPNKRMGTDLNLVYD